MSGKTKQPKHKMSAMAKKEERTAWLFIALPFLGFYFYGLSDLLCSVCKYEQVDGNEFSGG